MRVLRRSHEHICHRADPDETFNAVVVGARFAGMYMLHLLGSRGEFLIRMVASGLCHSDLHYQTPGSDIPVRLNGGHEGVGMVEELGEGVAGLEVGDHVITTFMSSCVVCQSCVDGLDQLCDRGGLGMNAVQEAAFSGASQVIFVEPHQWKRDITMSRFGATHGRAVSRRRCRSSPSSPRGRMADSAIIHVGQVQGEMTQPSLDLIKKAGVLAIGAVGRVEQMDASLNAPH